MNRGVLSPALVAAAAVSGAALTGSVRPQRAGAPLVANGPTTGCG